MNSLMTLIDTNQKVITPVKKGVDKEVKSDTNDFISILFKQIKNSIKIPSKTNIQTTMIDNTNEKYLKKANKTKTSDEILLGEILDIVSQLKENNPKINFPKFSDKMDKILSSESVKNDFKNVKNLDDIFKLSKKYNLKLEDIKFTRENIDTLKKDFPKLDFKNFFDKKPYMIQNTTDKVPSPIVFNSSVSIEQLLKNQSNKEANNLPKNILQTLMNSTDKSTDKIIIKSGEEDKKLKVESYIKNAEEDKKQEALISKKDNKKTAYPATMTQEKSKHIQQKESTINNIETKAKKEESKRLNKNSKLTTPTDNIKNEIENTAQNQEKNIKKSTITNDMREQKNLIGKDNQENILQTIKQSKNQTVKQNKILDENIIQNKAIDIQKDSDTNSKKENQNDNANQKHEYKTLTQTENHKITKQTETKQSVNTFTNDLKDKIEQYKPPIMKVKIALNPKNLGEVEVTLIHRGNNLHVNITSNTNTMSLFTQNQAEFKNSLVNMGFTNLEMNFSDQGKNSGQNQQNSKKHNSPFEEFQNSENHESSLELIIPKYI